MLPSDIGTAAADLLEAEGWIQNDYNRPGRGYCLYGAIYHCTGGIGLADRGGGDSDPLFFEREELLVAIGHRTGNHLLAEWNDDPDRTKAEAVSVVRAVAAELKGAGR